MAKLPPIPHSIPIYPIISSKHGWFCADLLLITPSIPKGLGKSSQSIDWIQGTFFGKPHISHRKKTWNFQWKKNPWNFQWISLQPIHGSIVRRTDDYVDYCSLAKNFRAMVMVPHGNVPLGRSWMGGKS